MGFVAKRGVLYHVSANGIKQVDNSAGGKGLSFKRKANLAAPSLAAPQSKPMDKKDIMRKLAESFKSM